MGGEPRKLSNLGPRISSDYVANARPRYSVGAGDRTHRFSGSKPLARISNGIFGELCARTGLSGWCRSATGKLCMGDVLKSGNPLKVGDVIVTAIKVFVVSLFPWHGEAIERHKNEPVDQPNFPGVALPQSDRAIASIPDETQRLPGPIRRSPPAVDGSVFSANLTRTGYLIRTLVSRYVAPFFDSGCRLRVSHTFPQAGALVRAAVGVLAPGGSFTADRIVTRAVA